jgi:hypothetical protein
MAAERKQKQCKKIQAGLLPETGSITRRQLKVRSGRAAKFTRAKSLPHLQSRLDPSSPVGTYAIDSIVEDFAKNGIFFRHNDLVRKAREAIDHCAQCCIMESQFTLIERPISLQKTNRFFDDLLRIKHLIARNEDLDPVEMEMSIRPRPAVDFKTHFVASYDRTQRLQQMLRGLSAEIVDYLQSYELRHSRQRNLDPLSHEFIRFMFVRVWPDLRFKNRPMLRDEDWFWKKHLQKKHYRPFVQFLATAWRDVGFPLEDHRGHSREPLESWFADRVRKDLLIREFTA